MSRLGSLSKRGRIGVLLFWGVLLLASMPFASQQVTHLTSGGFEVTGSQSDTAARVLRERFPDQTGEQMGLLLEWRKGSITSAEYRQAMRRFEAAVGDDPRFVPAPAALRGETPDGRQVALRPLDIHTTVRNAIDRAAELRSALDLGQSQDGPLTMELVGRAALVAAVHEESEQGAKRAEAVGVPLVLLILLVVFGSLAAAILPLLVGVTSVVVTGALIYLLSSQFAMSVFVVNVASMIGIGVAVDYSLFMLARYREEIAAGHGEELARRRMLATSGRSVVFAGGTVVVSLLSMFLLDNVILRSIAAGAMIVVFVAVLVSVTAMPAMVALLGRRLHAPSPFFVALAARLRRLGGARRSPRAGPFWERWTRRVMSHPARNAVAVTALLLVLAAPLFDLELGVDTVRQLPEDDPARQVSETARSLVKVSIDSPLVVTATSVTARPAEARALRRDLRRTILRQRGIAWLGPSRALSDAVLVEAIQHASPERERGQDAVRRVRASVGSLAGDWPRWDIAVGGTGATILDAAEQISGNLWKVVFAVLILSFAILLLLLRSVVLPLKAIAMNLLTVGAASGVLVAVFQWGWLEPVGIESLGHLEIYVPPLIFAVVYGLSMDYEVFLMTRIRERYAATGDNRAAVAGGVSSSARTISSAALIMVVVFSIFVATGVPIVQQIGLGTAVAIALDATLVRLVLLPAAMSLLGDLNWWLPAWLERLLGRPGSVSGVEPQLLKTEVGK